MLHGLAAPHDVDVVGSMRNKAEAVGDEQQGQSSDLLH